MGKLFGGSNEQSVEIPQWLEDAAKANLSKANDVAEIGYTPYYGAEVAAFNPMQTSSMQNTADASAAFGLSAPTDVMAGMPQAQDFGGGIMGYSSMPIYEDAMSRFGEARPGQKQAIDSMFIDPFTGQSGSFGNTGGAFTNTYPTLGAGTGSDGSTGSTGTMNNPTTPIGGTGTGAVASNTDRGYNVAEQTVYQPAPQPVYQPTPQPVTTPTAADVSSSIGQDINAGIFEQPQVDFGANDYAQQLAQINEQLAQQSIQDSLPQSQDSLPQSQDIVEPFNANQAMADFVTSNQPELNLDAIGQGQLETLFSEPVSTYNSSNMPEPEPTGIFDSITDFAGDVASTVGDGLSTLGNAYLDYTPTGQIISAMLPQEQSYQGESAIPQQSFIDNFSPQVQQDFTAPITVQDFANNATLGLDGQVFTADEQPMPPSQTQIIETQVPTVFAPDSFFSDGNMLSPSAAGMSPTRSLFEELDNKQTGKNKTVKRAPSRTFNQMR